MSTSRFAVSAMFSMDASKKAQLMEGLEPVVISMVRQLPGFVSGFWSWDHATNVTYAFIAFDTEADARALETHLKTNADGHAAQGARLERAAVGEIVGAVSGSATQKRDGADLWKLLATRG
jgi:hypothetical protein